MLPFQKGFENARFLSSEASVGPKGSPMIDACFAVGVKRNYKEIEAAVVVLKPLVRQQAT